MKVIVVYIGEIMHCPPALSLVQVLNELQINTTLCTIGDNIDELKHSIGDLRNVSIEFAGDTYRSDISLINKLSRMLKIRKKMWEIINHLYDNETVIWVVSEGSLKHLGDELFGKRYILHLLELNEGIYYISGNPILKLDYKRFAKEAKVVVEAEYNRAHITKAWWGLEELPMVFPNKPFNVTQITKNAPITSNDQVAETVNSLQGKKIILYQGNISKERPLAEYVKAVGELGSDYAFLMMINGKNPYPELKYDNFHVLGFINPPYHLEITSRAYIGILSYTPIKNDYSILNTLYCAPNKIWEYAQFGVPMIGNDLPALKSMFDEHKNGICVQNIRKNDILEAIRTIDCRYEEYSHNATDFFHSINMKEVVTKILEKAASNFADKNN